MRKRKWVKPPEPTMHQMIRNTIRTTCRKYNGNDYETTLDRLYLFMHGHNKQEVYNEISKWTDLTGVDLNTAIILRKKFFD